MLDDPHVELLSACPDLAARWGALHAKLWSTSAMNPGVLEACRQRVAAMIGADWAAAANPAVEPAPASDPLCAAALTVAELFVLDVRGVTDAHMTAIKHLASDDAMVHLCVGLALWDGIYRTAVCATPQ